MKSHLALARGAVSFPAGVLLGILLLGVHPSTAGAAGKRVSVTAVRHWSLGEITRVAVEASGEFTYRYERLSKPDRIYFDIQNANQRLSKNNTYSVEVNDGVIERIRVAQNQATVVRIVLYLNGRIPVKDSLLSNPDRLVLEIRGPGSKAYLAKSRKLPEL
ncbi:MAG: AMIN domain-containing protein, partial [bacterium]|nr:AMIN domain-containing protein [bacterium]